MSKIILSSCSHMVEQWNAQFTIFRKEWKSINETLVSLVTTWANKKYQLRSARQDSSYAELNINPDIAKEVEHTMMSELSQIRRQIDTTFDNFVKKIAEMSDIIPQLENQRVLFLKNAMSLNHQDQKLIQDTKEFQQIQNIYQAMITPETSASTSSSILTNHSDITTTVQTNTTSQGDFFIPLPLAICNKIIEWNLQFMGMYESELTTKRYILLAVLAPSHKKLVNSLQENSKLTGVPHLSASSVENMLNIPSDNNLNDVGDTEGMTFQQLQLYLTALSLEPNIDLNLINHVGNIVTHMRINQLAL